VIDEVPTQGAVMTEEVMDAAAGGDLMAKRRIEDERFAYFAEVSLVLLDLPDAVFRGYEGDGQLLGAPRSNDESPFEPLHREIARLEPQHVYLPLAVGGHVDHRLCRDAGVRLLGEARKWIMPGPEYAGIVSFYEDFPYAWWGGFRDLDDLGADPFVDLPSDVSLVPFYADISDQLERKITGIGLYGSQIDRLFEDRKEMARATRAYGKAMGGLGDIDGAAERYWVTRRV
jgi:LmbE family N-acetylglucosaminyl deacetylase